MAEVHLIGDPVAHSLSPAMQNAAFAALGLPHRYGLLRVKRDELEGAVRRLRDPAALGANVTIPHKEHVGRYLDAVDETAERIGAVNTLYKRGGQLRGANTDAGGFADALREAGVDVRGRRVLLLGAGGAAKACVHELVAGGADLSVANRTAERARALPGRAVAWPVRSLDGYDAVVNATSLGLHGEDPLDGVDLPAGLAVVDVIGIAEETPLIRRAKASGCVAVDGLLMLLHQGVRAFRLWTGLDAPLAAMRAALPRSV